MARTRYIKPEFFDSEDVARVSFGARLLFAGLWTLADREGRFELAPRRLKARLFPYDDVAIEPLLDELIDADMVVPYEAAGRLLGWIPGFLRHQKPHPKEPASALPACPEPRQVVSVPWNNRNKPGIAGTSREASGRVPALLVQNGNGNGDGDSAPPPPPISPSAPVRSALVMSPAQFERLSKRNAFVGARLIVPPDLHTDLRGKLGGASADERLRAWYRELDAEIETSGEEIEPTVWKWLDGRYQRWRSETRPATNGGYTPASEVIARQQADRAQRLAEAPSTPEERSALVREALAAGRRRTS